MQLLSRNGLTTVRLISATVYVHGNILARLSMRMAADTFLPNSSATLLPLLAEISTPRGTGIDRSMVDAVASTNCHVSASLVRTQSCVIRVLMVHHFTAVDAGAAARNVTATVCGLPVLQVGGTSAIGAGTVSMVGGGKAVWWREWWANQLRGNLSAAGGDYLPGLSSWADEPPLASIRAKQMWTAGISAYRAEAALRWQVLSNSECKVGEAGGDCVVCTLEMASHSAALVELSVGGPSLHKATGDS